MAEAEAEPDQLPREEYSRCSWVLCAEPTVLILFAVLWNTTLPLSFVLIR